MRTKLAIPSFARMRHITTHSHNCQLKTQQPRDYSSVDVIKLNKTLHDLVKYESLTSALHMFDKMPQRDVITWNIMISGYNQNGFPRKSLNLYNNMVSLGIKENSSTLSSILSICANAGLCKEGVEIHSRVVVLGFNMNLYIASALVNMYIQMGFIDVGLKLFYDLPKRNLAVWNVVLRGICELGQSTELLRLYSDMKLENVEPNGLTFCYLIHGCCKERVFDKGREMHSRVIRIGWLESSIFLANALVDFYSACGALLDADKAFECILPQDVISWNSMVTVYAANNLLHEAVRVLEEMRSWDKHPSAMSFVALLNLSSRRKELLFGKQIHNFVVKSGVDYGSVLIQSALIDMYGKNDDIESSVSVFQSSRKRSLECCNSMMTSLLHLGFLEDVFELFSRMVCENIVFDEVSLSSTIKALSLYSSPSLDNCALLHCCAIKSGFDSDSMVLCSLIDAYSRSGQIRFSQQIFEALPSPNILGFTSIINGYARKGMGSECLGMFEEMIQKGVKPDEVTFLCILLGCNHSGLVEEGKKIFESMRTLHEVYPDRRHYSCMVDLLGRAGLVNEAEELLNHASSTGDSVMWSSLLRSCRIHQNENVGRRAAKKLMDLEPEDPSVWLQASNFYSEIGEFETAIYIQEVAVARKMSSDIGYSLIRVHECH
ncbi:pentatricopeptide repeat-containing protein At4g13650-like [Lycium barbarum]|uniref:pentatricopeptide repeat-containing protein At4g13650-like n=1 Tax=Lycium barbarum TaxID=112863 RepID=UPI00293EF2D7|nr:pentatricopeptide repeat-containing protein At4g13650-like [Lycium barbarum]